MKNNNRLIYGIRPVIEAINNGKEIEKVILQRGIGSEMFKELFWLIRQREIPFQYVPQERLNRFTHGNHQGVVCFLSQIVYQKIEDIVPLLYENGRVPFVLLLDKITDVRNVGAIVRTAECAGVDAIILPDKGSASINEDAVKSSAGALQLVPICRHNHLKDVIKYLKNSGLQIVACTEKASTNYNQPLPYSDPICVIMGSEGEGITADYLSLCDHHVKIPMLGKIASLNVSVAAGIMLFEVVRQRNELK
ncbi:MAG: 23S rRNA (guanosine(2251)-2'-O)-methyltransferase RlmB [Bacteroidales bacterium]|jgi:23S rRNA (guanosine2251-2'-O)-methyltransferase|nr:23S rRNA (guanosine(2251)-2'-O)-methyltransferase RlmB [Bacteroidales bacterium]